MERGGKEVGGEDKEAGEGGEGEEGGLGEDEPGCDSAVVIVEECNGENGKGRKYCENTVCRGKEGESQGRKERGDDDDYRLRGSKVCGERQLAGEVYEGDGGG